MQVARDLYLHARGNPILNYLQVQEGSHLASLNSTAGQDTYEAVNSVVHSVVAASTSCLAKIFLCTVLHRQPALSGLCMVAVDLAVLCSAYCVAGFSGASSSGSWPDLSYSLHELQACGAGGLSLEPHARAHNGHKCMLSALESDAAGRPAATPRPVGDTCPSHA